MANEKRLIDANALLEKVQFRLPIDNQNAEVIAGCVDITRRLIENAATVDAVEVVRKRFADKLDQIRPAILDLNFYRNLFYAEPEHTERGKMARALNVVLPVLAEIFVEEEE